MTKTPTVVLIVDDNPVDRHIMQRQLHKVTADYACLEAETLDQALALCATTNVHCVVLDFFMPGLTAPQALAAGLNRWPVVVLTGQADVHLAVQCLHAGAQDYLTKDQIDGLSLHKAIQNAIEKFTLRRQVEAHIAALEQVQHDLEDRVRARTAELTEANARLAQEVEAHRAANERIRFQAHILDVVEQAVIVTDRQGLITYWNHYAEQMYGWTAADVLDRPITQILPTQEILSSHVLAQQMATGDGGRGEFVVQHRAGHWLPIFAITSIVRDSSGQPTHLVGVSIDIRDRKKREREREGLLKVAAALRLAPNRQSIVEVLLKQVRTLFDVDTATLSTFNMDSGEIILERVEGINAHATGARLPARGQGLSAHLFATGQPYYSQDLTHDIHATDPALIGPLTTAFGVPLVAQGLIIGGLWIGRVNGVITPDDQQLLIAIADIAANALLRATAHEETKRNLRRLTALSAIQKEIATNYDLRAVVDFILAELLNLLEVDAVVTLIAQRHTSHLTYFTHVGPTDPPAEYTLQASFQDVVGRAALERRIIHVADVRAPTLLIPRQAALMQAGFISYLAVPLVTKGQVKGVLEILVRRHFEPNHDWLSLAQTLATQIAIAIENLSLLEDLQRSNEELAQAYDSTLEGWTHALDLRDHETEGHSRRVAEMTVKLARALHVPEADLVHIWRGALLHDIGKMGIPDSILLKPGPLTPDEMKVMQRHPELAYQMLSAITYLRPALDIPYCHHEKWDGTGYPRGLRGEAIPFAARLFAVVDVWDALRSDRPYRAAWDEARVRAYLREQAGLHFEPCVVEAFLNQVLPPLP